MKSESLKTWVLLTSFLCYLVETSVATENNNIDDSQRFKPLRTIPLQNSTDNLTIVRRLDEYHEKMYGFNESTHPIHYKPWKVLEVVDGLKNEDVVMMITSSGVRNFHFLRERIIQSQRTWLRFFANTFVIIEDNFQNRYMLRQCKAVETSRVTTFECRNEPTYILSRKCTNEYYGGPGPCCKVDDLFTYLIFDRPELFAHTKFALHCDDDNYWRPDQVLHWLAAIEESGMNTFPIIANGNGNDPKENVWHINGCTEIHTNGWYQPMVLNHAALDRLKVASQNYGLAKTCSNFDVTHDVGMGPYAWLFGFYHTQLIGMTVQNSGGKNQLPQGYQSVHAMKHARKRDDCDNVKQWPDKFKYDQKMVIGCGTIDTPSPGHDPNGKDVKRDDGSEGENIVADMYDGWDFYRTHSQSVETHHSELWEMRKVTLYPKGTMLPGISTTGDEDKIKIKKILSEEDLKHLDTAGHFEGDEVVERNVLKLEKLAGYDTTEHSKKYDITKTWHEFKLTDCKVKGSVAH